jgi:type III restriction enzyme
VYAFGLQEAIDKEYLKKVRIHSYTNPKSDEFVNFAIDNFIENIDLDERHEGLRPKMAFFASQIDELQNELRPAVEAALARHGIPASRILVNVGDDKLTTSEDIREFNRLDTPDSEKQFILLVNKGREGWNCRSLFSVALYRKPRSKIFVLQASMRCLRSIGIGQQTGHVYLSDENREILEDEMQQNFRVSVSDIENRGSDRRRVKVKVNTPVETVKLRRVRRRYDLKEREPEKGYSFEFDKADTEQYRLMHRETEGLTDRGRRIREEDLTAQREKREFTAITLVAEIARYLNKSPLEIEKILESTAEKITGILAAVNEFNELLYDWVIPRLFDLLYEIEEYEKLEEYEVDLVKIPDDEFYEMSARKDLIVDESTADNNAEKSFHLTPYCFDSSPEHKLFWDLLAEDRVKKIYFTGMLTHGQSDFYVQYIDPESHTIRSYYPDFLVQLDDDSYIIVEVKGDNKVDDPVVLAKQTFAQQTASASGMRYTMIKGSDANAGNYQVVLDPNYVPPGAEQNSNLQM